jgi:hypothetical protein
MAATNVLLQNLSDEKRALVESWLVRFEQTWDEGKLPSQVRELPADPSLRQSLLMEMVKIDLERQWQRQRRLLLEDYLRDYPELGTVDSVPADLIQAEYDARVRPRRCASCWPTRPTAGGRRWPPIRPGSIPTGNCPR